MKNVLLLSLVLGLSLAARAQTAGSQAVPGSDVQRVTLYGPLARGHDASRAFVSFKTGAYGRNWDLGYGSLYVSEERDWFQVSTAEGVRTAFRDLGARDWGDSFEVPEVEPFPKLKPGERRTVVVDSSGADGKDGAPGRGADAGDWPPRPGDTTRPTPEAEGVVSVQPPMPTAGRPAPARRKKQDGVPKVDPIFARARVGHMYVLRVVDGAEDFYVLFRVESVVRGDNCTITWRRVPAPQASSAGKG